MLPRPGVCDHMSSVGEPCSPGHLLLHCLSAHSASSSVKSGHRSRISRTCAWPKWPTHQRFHAQTDCCTALPSMVQACVKAMQQHARLALRAASRVSYSCSICRCRARRCAMMASSSCVSARLSRSRNRLSHLNAAWNVVTAGAWHSPQPVLAHVPHQLTGDAMHEHDKVSALQATCESSAQKHRHGVRDDGQLILAVS
jgi:hypothetical protein